MRHVTDHLYRAVEQTLSPAGQASNESQHQANAATDTEANQRTPTADGQVLPQLATLG
ncbi:hypothetical protein D3C81_2272720 [compost metagenome]